MDPLSWLRLVETRVSYHYERRAKNEERLASEEKGENEYFLMAHVNRYSLQFALKGFLGT